MTREPPSPLLAETARSLLSAHRSDRPAVATLQSRHVVMLRASAGRTMLLVGAVGDAEGPMFSMRLPPDFDCDDLADALGVLVTT